MQQHLQGKRHLQSLRIQRLASLAEEVLDDLAQMNRMLQKLGKPTELSKTQARAAMRKIHINIFDLIEGRLQIFPTVWKLRAYSIKNKLIFPLSEAKAEGNLKAFLRKFNF